MKKLFTFCVFLAGVFCANMVNAQDIVNGNPGMYPEQIIFKDNAPVFKKGTVLVADAAGKMMASNDALFNHSEKDNLGFEHFRYQQSYQGIAVEDAVYVMHVQDGKVISQNGRWVKDFPAALYFVSTTNLYTPDCPCGTLSIYCK